MRTRPSAPWPGGWPAARSTWPSSSGSAMHCGAPATQQRTRQSPAAPSGARHLPNHAALARAAGAHRGHDGARHCGPAARWRSGERGASAMSPADSASPAWLTVPPADGLPEQVAGGIGPVANEIGFVPNVARLLAISPDHFIGWWRCFDELMGGPSGLSKTQREMIAVVV